MLASQLKFMKWVKEVKAEQNRAGAKMTLSISRTLKYILTLREVLQLSLQKGCKSVDLTTAQKGQG